MINAVLRFFDLYSSSRNFKSVAQGVGDEEIATWRQVVVYLACALGIVIGPYAIAASAGTYASFATMFGSPARLFWAFVFGFVLTAALFKIALSAKNAIVIQIGVALVAGILSGKIVPKAIDFLAKALDFA